MRDPRIFTTPGFNPNAPDPLGGGLAKPKAGSPTFGFPAPAAPPGAGRVTAPAVQQGGAQQGGGISGLQGLGLSLGDFAAGFRGQQTGPSQQLLAQRQQQFQERQQQLAQSIQIAQQFGQYLDQGPVAAYEERKAKARERYLQTYGPDSAEIFDTVIGSGNLTPAMIADLQGDEYGRMLLAGGSVEQIRNYFFSPEGFGARRERVDVQELPAVNRKFQAILATKEPAVRKLLEGALENGRFSPEEIANLNDQLPDQLRFSRGELEIIRRQEDKVEEANPKTFESSGTVKAKRELKMKADEQIRLQRAEQQAQADFGGPPAGSTLTANAQQEGFSRAQRTDFNARATISKLDRLLETPGGVGDVGLIFGFINALDETAVRDGERELLATAQSLRGRVQSIVGNLTSGTVVSDEQRAALTDVLRRAKEDITTDRVMTITNLRRNAAALGSRPEVIQSYDDLLAFGSESNAEAGAEGEPTAAPLGDEIDAFLDEGAPADSGKRANTRGPLSGGRGPSVGPAPDERKLNSMRRNIQALESEIEKSGSSRAKRSLVTAREELRRYESGGR